MARIANRTYAALCRIRWFLAIAAVIAVVVVTRQAALATPTVDVDQSGVVDADDLVRFLEACAEWREVGPYDPKRSPALLARADFNEDGTIDQADVQLFAAAYAVAAPPTQPPPDPNAPPPPCVNVTIDSDNNWGLRVPDPALEDDPNEMLPPGKIIREYDTVPVRVDFAPGTVAYGDPIPFTLDYDPNNLVVTRVIPVDTVQALPPRDAQQVPIQYGHPRYYLGDADADGDLDADDIIAFDIAVSGVATYYAQYPDGDILNCDVDLDGAVDLRDASRFADAFQGQLHERPLVLKLRQDPNCVVPASLSLAVARVDACAESDLVAGSLASAMLIPTNPSSVLHVDAEIVRGRSSPAIVDINDDGLNDIVIAANSAGRCAYNWHVHLFLANDPNDPDYAQDGAFTKDPPGWPREVLCRHLSSDYYRYVPSVAIGDINFDGTLDILAAGQTEIDGARADIFALDANGNDVPGWEGVRTSAPPVLAAPSFGDLNCDGAPGLLTTDESCFYNRHDALGRKHTFFAVGEHVYTSPAWGDVVNLAGQRQSDGLLEAVVATDWYAGTISTRWVCDYSQGAHCPEPYDPHVAHLGGGGYKGNPVLVDVDRDGTLDTTVLCGGRPEVFLSGYKEGMRLVTSGGAGASGYASPAVAHLDGRSHGPNVVVGALAFRVDAYSYEDPGIEKDPNDPSTAGRMVADARLESLVWPDWLGHTYYASPTTADIADGDIPTSDGEEIIAGTKEGWVVVITMDSNGARVVGAYECATEPSNGSRFDNAVAVGTRYADPTKSQYPMLVAANGDGLFVIQTDCGDPGDASRPCFKQVYPGELETAWPTYLQNNARTGTAWRPDCGDVPDSSHYRGSVGGVVPECFMDPNLSLYAGMGTDEYRPVYNLSVGLYTEADPDTPLMDDAGQPHEMRPVSDGRFVFELLECNSEVPYQVKIRAWNESSGCGEGEAILSADVFVEPATLSIVDWGDCDDNEVADFCEIYRNPALDGNDNGVLDVCEYNPNPSIAVWRESVRISEDEPVEDIWVLLDGESINECDILEFDASDSTVMSGDTPLATLEFWWFFDGQPTAESTPDAVGPQVERQFDPDPGAERSVYLWLRDSVTGWYCEQQVLLGIVEGRAPVVAVQPALGTQFAVGDTGGFVATVNAGCDRIEKICWDWDYDEINEVFTEDWTSSSPPTPSDYEQCRTWGEQGTYTVGVRVEDEDGDKSDVATVTVVVAAENPQFQGRVVDVSVERRVHVYDSRFDLTAGGDPLNVEHAAQFRLRNDGADALTGPLYLAFANLAPADAMVVSATGETEVDLGDGSEPQDAPYVQMLTAGTELAPDIETAWVPVTFSVPVETTEPGEFCYDAVAFMANQAPTVDASSELVAHEGQRFEHTISARDADGDSLYYELVSLDAAGDLSGFYLNAITGEIGWTPPEDFVNDNGGGVDAELRVVLNVRDPYHAVEHELEIKVISHNVSPEISGVPVTTWEAGGPLYSYSFTVTDADGDDMDVTVTAGGESIWQDPDVSSGTTCDITYDHAGQTRVRFIVVANDDADGRAEQYFDVDFVDCPPEDRPKIIGGTTIETARENELYTRTVFLDPTGYQEATFSLERGPGAMTITANGQIEWVPSFSDAGNHIVRVRAENPDNSDCYDTFAFSIAVEDVNTQPTVDCPVDWAVDEGTLLAKKLVADDVDGDDVYFLKVSGPDGLTVHPTTGMVRWPVSHTAAGDGPVLNYTATVQVFDERHTFAAVPEGCDAEDENEETLPGVVTIDIEVNKVDEPPTITTTPVTVIERRELEYEITAHDVDTDPGELTYALIDGPDGLYQVGDSNILRWTPPVGSAFGSPFTMRVGVSDTSQTQRNIRLDVVNRPPQVIEYSWTNVYADGVGGSAYSAAFDVVDWDGHAITAEVEPHDGGLAGISATAELVTEYGSDSDGPLSDSPVLYRALVTWDPDTTGLSAPETYEYTVHLSDGAMDVALDMTVTLEPTSAGLSLGGHYWFGEVGGEVRELVAGSNENGWKFELLDEYVLPPQVYPAHPDWLVDPAATLDADTGEFEWTDLVAEDVGFYLVGVRVKEVDAQGEVLQFLDIGIPLQIVEAVNRAPQVIEASWSTLVAVGHPEHETHVAAIEAVDVDGEDITATILDWPDDNPPLLTVESEGLDSDGNWLEEVSVEWTPGEEHQGSDLNHPKTHEYVVRFADTEGKHTDFAIEVQVVPYDGPGENQPPFFGDIAWGPVMPGEVLSVRIPAYDANFDEILCTLVPVPSDGQWGSGASFIYPDPEVAWVDPEDVADTYTFNWDVPTDAASGIHWFGIRAQETATTEHLSTKVAVPILVGAPDGQNTPPQIVDEALDVAQIGVEYAYIIPVVDPDVWDKHEFVMLGKASVSNAEISRCGGVFSWTPTQAEIGPNYFDVRVRDMAGDFDEHTLEISVSGGEHYNDPPTIRPLNHPEDGCPYTRSFVIEDTDHTPSELMVRLAEAPAGMTLTYTDTDGHADVSWSCEPTDPPAWHEVTLQATDPAGGQDVYSYQIQPVADSSPLFILEATEFDVDLVSATSDLPITLQAYDPDGDTETAVITFGGEHLPSGADIGGAYTTQLTGYGDVRAAELTWTPAEDQLGEHVFTVAAYDPAKPGLVTTQDITVYVSHGERNHAPVIVSWPPMDTVQRGELYSCAVEVYDEDPGDTLRLTIAGKPDNVELYQDTHDPFRLLWQTTQETDCGTYGPIVLCVSDTGGNHVTREYWITVSDDGQNHAPVILSVDSPPMDAGDLYTATIVAHDPDGADADLIIAFEEVYGFGSTFSPAAQNVDGVFTISWDASQEQLSRPSTLLYRAIVCDTDGQQQFVACTSTVVPIRIGGAGCESTPYPEFLTEPESSVVHGHTWHYTPIASDDVQTIALVHALGPDGTGAPSFVDYGNGTSTWDTTDPAIEAGYAADILFEATSSCWTTTQSALLRVLPNTPPELAGLPTNWAYVGTLYEFQVQVVDPDSQSHEFELADMDGSELGQDDPSIDTDGRITWNINPEAAPGLRQFKLHVRDEVNEVVFPFVINVAAAISEEPRAPLVDISIVRDESDLTQTIDAVALSDVSSPVWLVVKAHVPGGGTFNVDEVTVTLPGDVSEGLTLGDFTGGVAVLSYPLPQTVGVYTFNVTLSNPTATDGGTATASTKLAVYDDTVASGTPTAEFTSPDYLEDGDGIVSGIPEFTETVDINGYVNGRGVFKYVVSLKRAADTSQQEQVLLVEYPILDGNGWCDDIFREDLDTSLMMNGLYQVWLTVYTVDDPAQPAVYDVREFVVSGQRKIGHLTLSFTDLEYQVAGIPISVVRTYDSRDYRVGEFGTGWRLELNSLMVEVSDDLRYNWGFITACMSSNGCIPTSIIGHTVAVVWPGGQVEHFGAELVPQYEDGCSGLSCFTRPIKNMRFEPLGRSTSTLSLLGSGPAALLGADDEYGYGALAASYNGWNYIPWAPAGFVMETRDKTLLYFDREDYTNNYDRARRFRLGKIVDLNGNTVQFTDNGIVHTSADGTVNRIEFEYDMYNGHRLIKRVVAPDGKSVGYAYSYDPFDHKPDLAAVVDTANQDTTFTYERHLISDIIDPRGVPVARNVYDDDGRLISTTDAGGQTITFDHDPANAPSEFDNSLSLEVITASFGTDTLGQTAYAYDEEGNVKQEWRYSGENEYTYTEYAYDGRGNAISTKQNVVEDGQTYEFENTRDYWNGTDNLRKEESYDGSVTTYTYDDEHVNQVKTVTDARNHTTTNQYDPITGGLTTVTDARGHETAFGYNPETGLLDSLSTADPDTGHSITTSINYDERGRVSDQWAPSGLHTTFDYNDEQGIETQTRHWESQSPEDGTVSVPLTTSTELDLAGRPIKTHDVLGLETTTTYTPNGKVATQTDCWGTTANYYTPRGNLFSVVYPDGSDSFTEYDVAGRRKSTTDRDGRSTAYGYDWLGRLTLTVFDSSDPDVTANKVRSVTAYDELDRVISQSIVDENDATVSLTSYDYHNDDPVARMRTVTRHDPAEIEPDQSTTYYSDAVGNVVKIVDPLGTETAFTYDELNRQTRTTYADGTWTEVTYDDLGRKTGERDQNDRWTNFDYDKAGNLTGVRQILYDPLQGTQKELETNYEYDNLGNHIKTIATHEAGDSAPVTYTTYNARGQVAARYLPKLDAGDDWTKETFDYHPEHGLLTRHTTFAGDEIEYQYDPDDYGRLSRKFVPYDDGGSPATRKTEYTYFPGGQLYTVTIDDAVENTVYDYDARGRLTTETLPSGDILTHGYDAAGNRTSLTIDPAGQGEKWRYDYTYNGLGQLKSVTEVLDVDGAADTTRLATYFYDVRGNKTWQLNGNATATRWQYDQLGRLTDIRHYRNAPVANPDGLVESGVAGAVNGGTVISSFHYTLDAAGHRTGVTETLGRATDDDYRRRVVAYTYDSLYRLLREKAETYNRLDQILFDRTVTYTYDGRGNRLKMNVIEDDYAGTFAQTEYTVTYGYNDRDQLVTESRQAGPVVACTYGDGRRYAQAAHAAHIAPREAGAAVAGYWLFVALMMTFAGFVAWPGPRRRRARRVLNTAVCLFFVPLFAVDPANLAEWGNWALMRQAMAAPSADGAYIHYTYDDNGNIASEHHDDDGDEIEDVGEVVAVYTYDTENRLVEMVPVFGGEDAYRYRYDHDGVRVAREELVDGEPWKVTRFIVDKLQPYAQVLAEYVDGGPVTPPTPGDPSDDKLRRRYAYGDDLLTQTRNPLGTPATRYLHADGQLSTRQLTDTNADPAAVLETDRYTYDAFGEDLSLAGESFDAGSGSTTAYRYTGEHFDNESGHYHLRARQYDPLVGRFNGRDPFRGLAAQPLSLNKYVYCHADPITHSDPSGLSLYVNFLCTGALIAAVGATMWIWGRQTKNQFLQDLGAPIFLLGLAVMASGALIGAKLLASAAQGLVTAALVFGAELLIILMVTSLREHAQEIVTREKFRQTLTLYSADDQRTIPASGILIFRSLHRDGTANRIPDFNASPYPPYLPGDTVISYELTDPARSRFRLTRSSVGDDGQLCPLHSIERSVTTWDIDENAPAAWLVIE